MRDLSGRELEIVHLLAHGLTKGEIGSHLFISEWTVKSHLQRIAAALGCNANAVRVVVICIQRGLLFFDEVGSLRVMASPAAEVV